MNFNYLLKLYYLLLKSILLIFCRNLFEFIITNIIIYE